MFYQDMNAAYGHPKKSEVRKLTHRVINRIRKDLPAGSDVLAYFETGASNGPVEAIKGRFEYLGGSALGFRNLNH